VDDKVKTKVSDYATQIKELQAQIELQEKVIAVKSMTISPSSTFYKNTAGKRRIKLTWSTTDDISGLKYQVYRSEKKNSGYKKMISTSNKYYLNTGNVLYGHTYYYKVRAYIYVGGKYYYSNWSNVISRKATS